MTHSTTIHLRIFCSDCRTQLGYYEVVDREGLDELPMWTCFYCEECLTKKDKETKSLT